MEGVFTAAPHHDVLQLLIQFVVLLLTARLFGEFAQRIGQPSVVGEILAGIILGPSLLSGISPIIGEWIIPHNAEEGFLLEEISLLGVVFLLLVTGLETDLALIKRQARSAIGVAIGGLSLTLSIGFGMGLLIPDTLLVDAEQRVVFAAFLAIALAISAIPVVAKVLMDLNLTRRNIGQTIIACAMIDDTMGWVLLSVVIGMAGGAAISAGSILQSLLSVLGFMVISFTVGQWLVRRAIRFVNDHIQMQDKTLTLIVLLTFTWGTITHYLHLEALLGAFVMGILLSRVPSLDSEAIHKVEGIALAIFAPIFFAVAGLKVDIISLLKPDLLIVLIGLTLTAIVIKVTGVYLGARFIGKQDHWSAAFLGLGLNARGSMGIIVATIGITEGVLTQEMFSIIVVMALVTSLIAPAAMRWAVSHIEIGEEEQQRLDLEVANKQNIIANANRVLLPVRMRPNIAGTQTVEAGILQRLASQNPHIGLTLLTVTSDGQSPQANKFLEQISQLFPQENLQKKVVTHHTPSDAILDEAQRGYDLLILGATEKKADHEALFNPITDMIIRLSPCPTILIHGEDITDDWQPRRLLVLTNGSKAARQAAQTAFALAAGDFTDQVIVLHVIEKSDDLLHERRAKRRQEIAQQMVDELCDFAKIYGVQAQGIVIKHDNIADGILDVVRQIQIDLIVMGTSIRAGSQRLYLGPSVEQILYACPCPVMIVNSSD
ncbi:MAG: hypothetical protein CUN56_06070 [Phototrophicales bacterium]|nr:MAG: hypothetical protein CUN56_06070 [Phototrophicales bacterium]RMG71835.1 MAG: hypothetical protein D6711_14455 [Chloroflexota bacterium]